MRLQNHILLHIEWNQDTEWLERLPRIYDVAIIEHVLFPLR